MSKGGNLWKLVLVSCVLSLHDFAVESTQDDVKEDKIQNYSNIIENDVQFEFNRIEDTENFQKVSENAREENIPQSVFIEASSQNVGVLNDITSGTPSLVPLAETSTLELKAKLEELQATVDASKTLNETENNSILDSENFENTIKDLKNDTDNLNRTSPEDIPSFSEWAQKRLEEAEKNGDVLNESIHQNGFNGKSSSNLKMGWRNYASPDCGAKVVAANPEARSPSSVISPSREEYKLNVCTDRIWFVVELCEAIQAKKIELANFELFSSTPKDFTVSVTNRFPSREWTTVGQFTAKDERDIQSFDLNPYLFGRYIRVEIKSHHGSQHFCPISLFRVYGISELEILQKEESAQNEDDDDEDDNDATNQHSEAVAKNMLNSATDAVYSMIKKAAEVLVTKKNGTEEKENIKLVSSPLINTCSTPCHRIVCVNCTDILFGQIYEILNCKSFQINNLIDIPFIRKSLLISSICKKFGLVFNEKIHVSLYSSNSKCIESFFSPKYLGAMCNILAVTENKAVLNISQQYQNITNKVSEMFAIPEDKILNVEESIKINILENNVELTEDLKLEITNIVELPKATCSTDSNLAFDEPIEPTKTVHLDISNENNDSEEFVEYQSQSKTSNVETTSEIPNISKKVEVEDVADEQGISSSTEAPDIDQIENDISEVNNEAEASTLPPIDRQKESVFLRLSNRIKALERNVSLSSQYLEELSRRYKKQVEEMQKQLEKTLQTVMEERKKMYEQNKQLEERLDHLMNAIGKIPSFLIWSFSTLAMVYGFIWICGGRKQNVIISDNLDRRNSFGVVSTIAKKPKIRRPSDQALKIVRSSIMTEERKLSREKRKRKRSNKMLKRSNSATGLESDASKKGETNKCLSNRCVQDFTCDRVQDLLPSVSVNDWVVKSRDIEVIPFPLDESEHSSLEAFSTMVDQKVPYYTKTAVDSRAERMSSHSKKPNLNGEHGLLTSTPRKNGSLDETYRFKGSFVRHNSLSNSLEGSERKKEKKSIKSVLKNVFT